MFKNCIVVGGLLFGMLALNLRADEKAADPVQVSLTLESGYAARVGGDSNGTSSLGFSQSVNRVRLTNANVSINADWQRFGFHVDAGLGDFYRYAMAGDSWKGPNQYVSQAYLSFKPLASVPVKIDAGKFFSSVGAEVPQGYLDSNFNATRSLLFWYGSPLYHMGVRATAPISKSLTIGAQLLSGSNTIYGAHGHQSMAYTATYSKTRASITETYLAGNQKLEGSGWRQLSDTVVTLTPSSKLTGYLEYLSSTEKRVTQGHDRWCGAATSWRYAFNKQWAISPRFDWYNDATGSTSGVAQHMKEWTLTAEFRPARYLISRLEYRRDFSDRSFYADNGSSAAPSSRATMVASMIVLLQKGQ